MRTCRSRAAGRWKALIRIRRPGSLLIWMAIVQRERVAMPRYRRIRHRTRCMCFPGASREQGVHDFGARCGAHWATGLWNFCGKPFRDFCQPVEKVGVPKGICLAIPISLVFQHLTEGSSSSLDPHLVPPDLDPWQASTRYLPGAHQGHHRRERRRRAKAPRRLSMMACTGHLSPATTLTTAC